MNNKVYKKTGIWKEKFIITILSPLQTAYLSSGMFGSACFRKK